MCVAHMQEYFVGTDAATCSKPDNNLYVSLAAIRGPKIIGIR